MPLGTLSPSLLAHYMARNQETINELDEATKTKMQTFYINVYNKYKIFLLLYEGYRTYNRQEELYFIYVGGGSLAAPPTKSWHEYRRAVDVMPINSDGSNGFNSMTTADWQKVYNEANLLGLSNGSGFGDSGHFWNPDYIGQTLEFYLQSNSIPYSNTPEWQQYHAPKTAGFGSWFFIAAAIGLFISEDLRKN